MVAYFLSVQGSLNVIRRSLMAFGRLESLPTRSVLMANPAPTSRLSAHLRPLQRNVYPAPTSLIPPAYARRVSINAAIPILYLPSSLPTRAVLRCSVSDPVLSIPGADCQRYHSCFLPSCSTAKRDAR